MDKRTRKRMLPMSWTDADMAEAYLAGYNAGEVRDKYLLDDVGDEFGAWVNDYLDRTDR